jgi:hypothetical protein
MAYRAARPQPNLGLSPAKTQRTPRATRKFEARNPKSDKEERVSSDECQGMKDFPLDTRPSTLAPSAFRYSNFEIRKQARLNKPHVLSKNLCGPRKLSTIGIRRPR